MPHGNEEEIKEVLAFSPKNKKRKKKLEKLCRMGNFNSKTKVQELGEGELKVVRRLSAEMDTNPNNYLPCKFCYVFFQKAELWRRAPKCPFQEDDENNKVA